MNLKLNLPQSLADRWTVAVIDGKVSIRQKPQSNQLDRGRLAFIKRLEQEGWRHAAGFSVLNFSQVFLHRDLAYAVKVSRLYNPRAQGWRDFAAWTIEQQAGGELSPYLPRIWGLEVHERWYSAKMERLQEIDDYRLDDSHSDRIKNQIAEVRRRLQTRDFSISEGDDLDLVDVLQRLATRFDHDWVPYDDDDEVPDGWPRDCNFMIRPGDTPQLVLNDPISEELPDAQPAARSGLASLAELFVAGAAIVREVGRADRN